MAGGVAALVLGARSPHSLLALEDDFTRPLLPARRVLHLGVVARHHDGLELAHRQHLLVAPVAGAKNEDLVGSELPLVVPGHGCGTPWRCDEIPRDRWRIARSAR